MIEIVCCQFVQYELALQGKLQRFSGVNDPKQYTLLYRSSTQLSTDQIARHRKLQGLRLADDECEMNAIKCTRKCHRIMD